MKGTPKTAALTPSRLLVGVLLVAAALRLWQLGPATEFLGDQGSAGVVIYEAWQSRTIPLLGPTVSLGIRPGPLYYYLLAPWLILGGFNPIAAAAFFAVLGVVTTWLVFRVGKRLFSVPVGLAIGALYAVSPAVVEQSRMMWNPTAIPFFAVLLVWLLLRLRDTQRLRYALAAGAAAGCLVQLHYTTLIFTGFLFLVQALLWLPRAKKIPIGRILSGWVMWIGGFVLALSPFLLHEFTHNAPNIRELLLMLLGEGPAVSESLASHPTVAYGFGLELIRNIVPFTGRIPLWIAQFVLLAVAVIRGRKWGKVYAVAFIAGILVMSRYKGPMFGHYFYFLLPLPFILFGYVLQELKQRVGAVWLVLLLGLLGWVAAGNFRLRNYPFDVARTSEAVTRMREAAGSRRFSFTLTKSRSFSDFHYRYYFRLAGTDPVSITDSSYPVLFLVCEQLSCPGHEELERMRELPVMCFDHHCSGFYPHVFFDDWEYTAALPIRDGVIYQYVRRNRELPGDR